MNILEDILNKDFEVLEIGPGPGTLTISLSEKVRKITCVEASKANLQIKGIKNFELTFDSETGLMEYDFLKAISRINGT